MCSVPFQHLGVYLGVLRWSSWPIVYVTFDESGAFSGHRHDYGSAMLRQPSRMLGDERRPERRRRPMVES
jgi:hypothetical protein